jgi:hypothetical protein
VKRSIAELPIELDAKRNEPAGGLIPDNVFATLSSDCLAYLQTTPTTPIESLICQRKLSTASAVRKFNIDLRFLLGLVGVHDVWPLNKLHLRIFVIQEVCQWIQRLLAQRKVSPGA